MEGQIRVEQRFVQPSAKFVLFKKVFWRVTLLCALYLFVPSSLPAQTILEVSKLTFPGMISPAGGGVSLTVLPTAANAASFDISGTPNTPVFISILETKKAYLTLGTRKMTVTQWLLGGSVVDLGNGTAQGTLDALGQLNNVRVGGVLSVPNNAAVGYWSGVMTLRVIY